LSVSLDETQCFHCGDTLPDSGFFTAEVDGVAQRVCCAGCAAVATLIDRAAMTAFYRQRSDYPPRPDAALNDDAIAQCYDEPSWLATFAEGEAGCRQIPLMVTGMSCAACAWIIERFLNDIPGVQSVHTQLTLGKVVISLAPDAPPSRAVSVLQDLGYGVQPWRADARMQHMHAENRRDLRRIGIAFLGMMQVGMFSIALHAGSLQGIDADLKQLLRLVSMPLTLFVLVYSARGFFESAWQHMKKGVLIMDTSVSLALLLATTASVASTLRGGGETYFDSVTMFIFFLLLARYIEKRLRDRDLIQLVQLADQLPEFVMTLRDTQWQRVPRHTIEKGDTVRVLTGEAIAFDACVTSGCSSVNEQVFTGEALPRGVHPGERVYAGTINEGAGLELTVERRFVDSRLAALAGDVEQARGDKPVHMKLVDQFAGRFIGLILASASATCLYWLVADPTRALWSTIAVLVVACPCALSLATPAALASGNAWLLRHGVRVRSESGLLAAAAADHAIFDKTGTLTETQLIIDAVVTNDNITVQQALNYAASLQRFSHHPAARSFHDLAADASLRDVEVVTASGVEGWDNRTGDRLRLGSESFCRDIAASMPVKPDDSHYWIALVSDRHWLAWIALSEALRDGAASVIENLKAQSMNLEIMSGDTEARVRAIARTLDMPFSAALQPDDKLRALQERQQEGHTVLAVGDGLNDAPLMGAADVSIAVAGAAALAQAQADFVIEDGRIESILTLRRAAMATQRITRQNLFWAAGYNLTGVPLAAMGLVPPWIAAIGMSASSLLVVLNALRLRRLAP